MQSKISGLFWSSRRFSSNKTIAEKRDTDSEKILHTNLQKNGPYSYGEYRKKTKNQIAKIGNNQQHSWIEIEKKIETNIVWRKRIEKSKYTATGKEEKSNKQQE